MPAFHTDPEGLSHTVGREVAASMTAAAAGSGDVEVLATPYMILLMEMAARNAVAGALSDGWTTVGTRVDVSHLAPTPPGEKVTATATVVSVRGRRIGFGVEARSGGRIIGRGSHTRAAVRIGELVSPPG
jgi:predicted thioesterase